MSEAKIEANTVCEDRISDLPEDLLVKILSFLPTKEAVTTMILSKRWRLIWTMVRTLSYQDSKEGYYRGEKSVWWFLNKSLQFHKTQLGDKIHVIEKLLIELRSNCPTNADVGKWIAYAVDRGVIDLKFKLRWFTDPISLPKSLYCCETLTDLSLSREILVDFPFSSCLPSLLNLKLSFVEYKDEASLVRLLSSCPVLTTLIVKRNKYDNVRKFNVKVPSLRSLSYINYESLSRVKDDSDEEVDGDHYDDSDVDDDIDVEDYIRCLVIDTPALKRFKITDCSGESCFVNNMPCLCLKYATIYGVSFPEDFISFLSSVLSLKLDLTDAVVNHCSIINLSQLVELKIRIHVSNWLEPLMLLLENAPKLKSLTVECEYYNDPRDLSPGWNQLSCVPTCLASQLERFEWIEYGNIREEKEFLRYFFANSKCLKTAKISLRSSFESVELCDLIFKELENIPRISTSSKVFFTTGNWGY